MLVILTNYKIFVVIQRFSFSNYEFFKVILFIYLFSQLHLPRLLKMLVFQKVHLKMIYQKVGLHKLLQMDVCFSLIIMKRLLLGLIQETGSQVQFLIKTVYQTGLNLTTSMIWVHSPMVGKNVFILMEEYFILIIVISILY